MKRTFPILLIALAGVFLATTGFQCGSAEMTTARLAMNQGQWEKAEQSLMKELQKNDKNEEAWFELGRVRWNMKKYLEANEAFDRALAISPSHASEISAFRINLWQQNINDGVELYNRGLRLADSPDSTVFADSAFARAVRNFTVATQVIPDSAYGYYLVGVAKSARGDYDGAESAHRAALAKRPDFPEVFRMLGALYLRRADEYRAAKNEDASRDQLRKAAALYVEARKTNPDDPDFVSRLIAAYQGLGEDANALGVVKEMLAKDPDKREYVYVYGEYLLKSGDFEQSIELLQKSMRLKDTLDIITTSATTNLGIAYQNWGVALREKAQERAEAAAKAGKKLPEDLSYLEKYRDALPYFERTVETNPRDAESWDRLAKLYTALNMKDKARMAYDKVDSLIKDR